MNPHPRPDPFKNTAEVWHGPACEYRKYDIREQAAILNLDADAFALQRFGCDVGGLKECQSFTLQCELGRMIEATKPQVPPHDVRCITCDGSYRCFCSTTHRQGECVYCANGTSRAYQNRRASCNMATMHS